MNRGLIASILLSAIIAGPASAQKVSTKKSNALEISEKKAEGVLKPDSDKEEKIKIADAKIDKIVAAKQARLSQVRLRQIEKMRGILRKNPLYRGKANLLFRIAEREWDEAKYRYMLAQQAYDERHDAYLNGTLKKKPEEPTADYTKAIKEYKNLLKEYPNYRRINEVIFYLGRGLIQANFKQQGASYMLRLTKEYPKSRYVTQAYLAVAEYYFDKDLLFAAKKNYLKVLEKKGSAQYPYALYKLGYVYYNLKEYEDSIKSFKGVVDLSKGKDRRKVYFTNQAYSAMTLSFSEVPSGWKRARDYFMAQGGKELAVSRLESIARTYNKQDKLKLEIEVYEYLIGADKSGQEIPKYAKKITENYRKQEDEQKIEETINRFVTRFDPKGSWYAVNKQYEMAAGLANQYREEYINMLLEQYHIRAQKVEKLKKLELANKLYRKAAKYYERYLELFPEKDVYEKNYSLADIYFFEMKEWDKAAERYRKVVDLDRKGKYSIESAYAIILARQEKLIDAKLLDSSYRSNKRGGKKRRGKVQKASVEFTKRKKSDKDFKPKDKKPFAPLQKDFLGACTDYLTWYPKDSRVPGVSFMSAELFIDNGHYADGIKSLEVIMESHPKHRFAGIAAEKLFDANNRLKRWDQIERWGRYMLKRRNFKYMSKKRLLTTIAQSINNYATELYQKGKAKKGKPGLDLKLQAFDEFMRLVKEFPRHKLKDGRLAAPIALNNAATVAQEAEKVEEAIQIYERIIKDYKKSSQATMAHDTLGKLYQSQTDFERAARYFEKMAAFPDVEERNKETKNLVVADALYNAGLIRVALEQNDRAIAIFETYAKKYPLDKGTKEGKSTPSLIKKIAELHVEKGRLKKALKVYDRYLKITKKSDPAAAPSIFLAKAELYQKLGGNGARRNASAQLKKATNSYKKLKKESQAKGLVRATMARVRFLEAEYIYQDFEAIQLKFPIGALKRGLVKKGKVLLKANKLLFEVLEYKAWQVAAGALYRIGESFFLYAKSLFDLPLPKGLSEDEIDVYRAELDDKAAPLQEKAIEATKKALELAHKHHVYNEWSRKAAALLVKLSPELFPVLDDAVVNTEWTVPSTFSTTFIADPGGTLKQMLDTSKPKAKAPGTDKAASSTGDKSKTAKGSDATKTGATTGDKKAEKPVEQSSKDTSKPGSKAVAPDTKKPAKKGGK